MVFYNRDQVVNNEAFHLASRGGHANKHPGNKASRNLIRQYAAMYVATKKSERGAIARQLYETHFQDKRVFVIEREYFLRCIEDDRKTAQQGGPRGCSRRKLSDDRVASVVGANGGSLASILALPSRVFIHTGESFAIDTVDHLLREEAKRVRRHNASNNDHPIEHTHQFSNFSRAIDNTALSRGWFSPTMNTAPSAADKSSSGDSKMSLSSMEIGKLSPASNRSTAVPAIWSLENFRSWESMRVRKNQSATNRRHGKSPVLQQGESLGQIEELTLWKAWSENTTDKDDELLKPIASSVLDTIWSDNEGEDFSSDDDDVVTPSEMEEENKELLREIEQLCSTSDQSFESDTIQSEEDLLAGLLEEIRIPIFDAAGVGPKNDTNDCSNINMMSLSVF